MLYIIYIIYMKPAFIPISEDFSIKWNQVFSDAEGKLGRFFYQSRTK